MICRARLGLGDEILPLGFVFFALGPCQPEIAEQEIQVVTRLLKAAFGEGRRRGGRAGRGGLYLFLDDLDRLLDLQDRLVGLVLPHISDSDLRVNSRVGRIDLPRLFQFLQRLVEFLGRHVHAAHGQCPSGFFGSRSIASWNCFMAASRLVVLRKQRAIGHEELGRIRIRLHAVQQRLLRLGGPPHRIIQARHSLPVLRLAGLKLLGLLEVGNGRINGGAALENNGFLCVRAGAVVEHLRVFVVQGYICVGGGDEGFGASGYRRQVNFAKQPLGLDVRLSPHQRFQFVYAHADEVVSLCLVDSFTVLACLYWHCACFRTYLLYLIVSLEAEASFIACM